MPSSLTAVKPTLNPSRINALLRMAILLCIYSTICAASIYLAYELRYDFAVPEAARKQRWDVMLWLVPLELVLLFAFGQFNSHLSYFRMPDLYRIFGVFGTATLFLVYLWYISDGKECPPRASILANLVLCITLLGSFRTVLRVARERYMGGSRSGTVLRVAIVGANDVGAAVASDLLARRSMGLRPVLFLDKNRSQHGKEIHGLSVVGSPDDLEIVVKRHTIEKIVIALPSNEHRTIRDIVAKSQLLKIPAEIVPSFAELATGQVRTTKIRPVELADLLGREPVSLDSDQIHKMLAGKVVFVTGAGGSIGSELCRQIIACNPQRLIMIDQSEVQLFPIEQELSVQGNDALILPIVADILDLKRMRLLFERFKPDLVFHAAAHKHVPLMESQPGEALRNNTFGTMHLALLASQMKVDRFVLISTDKAINPTNVMGASKRLAEISIQAIARRPDNETRFMAVRFGNVLGSSGSVILTFKRQISEGGPVTVTHPEVTRYFMTIPEAVGLVLQCGTQGQGGEIFVLDMGEPIKIVDVARQLIELSGFKPDIDIPIQFVGLRPGEKLYEELQHKGEQFAETAHPRIFRFISEAPCFETLEKQLLQLDKLIYTAERNQIKQRIQSIVPEYQPFLD